MDFLNYWDTRIDANERFFNNYPHIANFAFSECQELWDRMSADYAALLARHNALREAVAWERECCQDIRPLVAWADLYVRHGEDYVDGVAEDLRAIQDAARAAVDRLIASQGSVDCKGGGMIELHGFICSSPVYEYKGWVFELNYNCGPWPLRRDGELRTRAGRVFWRVFSEWEDLPDDEKKRTRVGGGCVSF